MPRNRSSKSKASKVDEDPGVGGEQILRSNQFSKSLAKGLAVLACFSPERPTLSVSDISEALGMTRSTAHRYASTLVALRYLQQDQQRRYELAARVSDLGRSALSATPLRVQARLELEQLRRETGCTVGLAVLDGTAILYVDRLPSHRTALYDVKLPIGAGSRLPAYCTAMGKVLLEQVGAAEVAFDDEELAAGLRSIAAPVRNEARQVTAAVSLAAQSSMISLAKLVDTLSPQLVSTADRISARLGYRRDDE